VTGGARVPSVVCGVRRVWGELRLVVANRWLIGGRTE